MSGWSLQSRRSFTGRFLAACAAIYGGYQAAVLLAEGPNPHVGPWPTQVLAFVASVALVSSSALVGAAVVHRRHRRALDAADGVTGTRATLAGALGGLTGVALSAALVDRAVPMPFEIPVPLMNGLSMLVGAAIIAAGSALATRALYAPWLPRPTVVRGSGGAAVAASVAVVEDGVAPRPALGAGPAAPLSAPERAADRTTPRAADA